MMVGWKIKENIEHREGRKPRKGKLKFGQMENEEKMMRGMDGMRNKNVKRERERRGREREMEKERERERERRREGEREESFELES